MKRLRSVLCLMVLAVGSSASAGYWSQIGNCAKDVAANGGTGTYAWAIGCNPVTGGYGIWFNPSGLAYDWHQIDGGAVRIATSNFGDPWAVNSAGNIFRRVGGPNGYWETLPGLASDIGIGGNGHVWIVGRATNSSGGQVYYWNGSGWTADFAWGARIAVGPDGQPWVTTLDHRIFRRLSTGAWQQWSGAARDIAVNQMNSAVWIVGNTAVSGGYRVFRYSGGDWVPHSIGAVAITAGGEAILAKDNGDIFVLIDNTNCPEC
jgi:hypothetical protein